MNPVSSEAVAAHHALVGRYAQRFAGLDVALAEYDDLFQVGTIRVWKLLETGKPVTALAIQNAMIDELRRVGRIDRDEVQPVPDDLLAGIEADWFAASVDA